MAFEQRTRFGNPFFSHGNNLQTFKEKLDSGRNFSTMNQFLSSLFRSLIRFIGTTLHKSSMIFMVLKLNLTSSVNETLKLTHLIFQVVSDILICELNLHFMLFALNEITSAFVVSTFCTTTDNIDKTFITGSFIVFRSFYRLCFCVYNSCYYTIFQLMTQVLYSY